MDTKLLLLTAISLLYTESRTSNKGSSVELVKEAVKTIMVVDAHMDIDRSRDTTLNLKSTVNWMCDHLKTGDFDRDSFVQRLRLNLGRDQELLDSIMDCVNVPGDDSQRLIKTAASYKKTINAHLRKLGIKKLVSDANRAIAFDGESVDADKLAMDLMTKLEPFALAGLGGVDASLNGRVDFSDDDSIKEAFEQIKEDLSSEGGLSTGYQGLNRMLGSVGSWRRGEFIIYGGLEHTWKSGFMLSQFRQIPQYNIPIMRNDSKRTLTPLNLRISLENDLREDVVLLYKGFIENETKQRVIVDEIDIESAKKYIQARLNVNGWKTIIERRDPTTMSLDELLALLDRYEADGFEIQNLQIDYLAMLKGAEANRFGNESEAIRYMFRKTRNYTTKRRITCMTPHQLAPGDCAKILSELRGNEEEFVKRLPTGYYWDGCKRIGQEADLVIYGHKVEVGGKAYMTFYRGKHRGINDTRPDDKYCIYPFFCDDKGNPLGDIPDDRGGIDMSRKSINNLTIGLDDDSLFS